MPKSTLTASVKPAQAALLPSKGLKVREHHCLECGERTHRDRAAAEMVLHRGLENVVAQGLWGTETNFGLGKGEGEKKYKSFPFTPSPYP